MFLEPFETLGKAEENDVPQNQIIGNISSGISVIYTILVCIVLNASLSVNINNLTLLSGSLKNSSKKHSINNCKQCLTNN